MLIPHLHFCGDCEEAISVYEKAFNTRANTIVRNRDYAPMNVREILELPMLLWRFADKEFF